MAARLGSLVLLLLSFAISGEVGSFLYLRYIAGADWKPAYLMQGPAQGRGWLTEREPWGAWHWPNDTGTQKGRCFSVALRSNFFGARDRERTIGGDAHRTIVLGDSFAEGWGIEEDERLSNLLEARYDREFLNFGIENDTGPLQYQLIYERLASRFSHDQVLIMFLPDNDFTDNDAEYWRRFRADFPERYRPYYQAADDGGYRPFYPVSKPADNVADLRGVPQLGWPAWAANTIRRNSWSAATYRYLRLQSHSGGVYSGYVDFTADQLRAMLWSFARIKALAGEREVTILVIPRLKDFLRVASSGDHRLIEALDRFGQEHDVKVIDLLQWMPKVEPRTEQYYLPCNGHWSATGNRVAADALGMAIRYSPLSHAAAGVGQTAR